MREIRGGGPRTEGYTSSTIPGALAAFGIDPSSVEVVAPLVSGAGRVQGFRVRVDDRDWALKRYRTPASVERLRTSHPLETRLAEAGFPVAALCADGDGATVVRDGSLWYTLHRWVDGQHISIVDRETAISTHQHLVGDLAAMIATLHMVAGQIPDEGGDPDPDRLLRGPYANVRRIRASGRRVLSKWQRLRMRPRKSEFDRWALRVVPEMEMRAEALAGTSIAHRVPRSEIGLIHNDVNWENLIFDEELRVQALIDFDNVVRAPWALEVGACAVVLAGTDADSIDRFVSGYEATAGASLDRDLVRLGMELKCVRSIMTSVVSYLDGGMDTRLVAPWCHHLYKSLQLVKQE